MKINTHLTEKSHDQELKKGKSEGLKDDENFENEKTIMTKRKITSVSEIDLSKIPRGAQRHDQAGGRRC